MAEPAVPTEVRAWLDSFADRLGTEAPDDEAVTVLLDLAGVAAHASQRMAAPIACWLAARAGVPPADALAAARTVQRPAR